MKERVVDWLQRYSKRYSRENLYPLMEQAITKYVSNDGLRILSVGAGGRTEEVLNRRRLRFRSVDVDAAKNPDIVATVEDLPMIADASVDVVFCMEVLEHVREPWRASLELSRILAPSGILIGSTPFILGIHDDPHDFYRFTRQGIDQLFAGFERLQIEERNGYFGAVGVLLLRPLIRGNGRRRAVALSPLLLGLFAVLRLLDRVLARRDGTTGYFFVFRKR